jgi:ABC-2 type transport system ATP-binding protein
VLLTTQYMEEAERLAHRIVVIDTGRVVAEGTSAELKDRLGGATIEARVSRRADLGRAASLLAQVGAGPPFTDADQQLVRVGAPEGTAALLKAGRLFEEQQVPLDDLGIRRPSLDDVFLSLTGTGAAPAADDPASSPQEAA